MQDLLFLFHPAQASKCVQAIPGMQFFLLPVFNHRCNDLFSGNMLAITSSVTAISFGSPLNAAQRKGPLPSQKSGRIYAGTKPGKRPLRSLKGDPVTLLLMFVFILLCTCSYIITIIKGDCASILQLHHQLHMMIHAVDMHIQYIVVGFCSRKIFACS